MDQLNRNFHFGHAVLSTQYIYLFQVQLLCLSSISEPCPLNANVARWWNGHSSSHLPFLEYIDMDHCGLMCLNNLHQTLKVFLNVECLLLSLLPYSVGTASIHFLQSSLFLAIHFISPTPFPVFLSISSILSIYAYVFFGLPLPHLPSILASVICLCFLL